ncbi:MAG: Monofunctional biosynthetic peptidoglycan transglycosylase [uncultured bacterium]|nr:MAG: Monofunctional biosynthetic peptidoglycan transglycosylase [uncultured bacterium]
MLQKGRSLFKIILAGIFLLSASFVWNMPNMSWLIIHNPTQTPFMDYQREKLVRLNQEPEILQIWVSYENIAPSLKRAVLAAEDDTFFDHNGFNWKEIKKAYYKNLKDKKYHRGASTITQQLVKNLYLGPQKSIYRKLKEALFTIQMEHTLPKERIFELYLNLIEWGPGIFGVEAASEFYFKKNAKSLSESQAAYLAALIPNPLKFSQPGYSGFTKKRALMIQKRSYAQLLKPITLPSPTNNKTITQTVSPSGEVAEQNVDEVIIDEYPEEIPEY